MQQSEILVSICIPTYNRASYLELCLRQFCKQLDVYQNRIEIIVGDNASTDDTGSVVNKFIQSGFPVQYYRHFVNMGADANVLFCINRAKGNYVWIMGDDDLLLNNCFKPVAELLLKDNYQHVYLGNYWFGDDYEKEMSAGKNYFRPQIFPDKKSYLKAINIWVTFLSAHIFKREVFQKLNLQEFTGTNLNQLQWVLTSMFSEGDCVYVYGNLLACKGNNTGGYSLFQSFGPNLNRIILELSKRGLVPAYAADVLNYYFIKDFMPLYCIRYKQKKLPGFETETSPFQLLHPLYKKYISYWLILKPIDWLPVFIGKKYYFGLKLLKLI